MKYLVIARHGHYGQDDNLSNLGSEQMLRMSQKIANLKQDLSATILCSSAPRAEQSAKIISDNLGIPSATHPILWSDNKHRMSCEDVYKLVTVAAEKVDVVILVTHLEYSDNFPLHFASVEGWNKSVGFGETEKGEAWVLDCENQTKKLL